MKDSEAQDIIRLIDGATGGRVRPNVEAVFKESLIPLDASLATDALMAGRRDWHWFPSWSQFAEAYRAQERLRMPVGEQRDAVLPPVQQKVPFWVKRWIASRYLYVRFGRDQDMRPFHEQRDYVDPESAKWMPDGEWDEEAKHVTESEVWNAVRA
jgi:hypothetical protein